MPVVTAGSASRALFRVGCTLAVVCVAPLVDVCALCVGGAGELVDAFGKFLNIEFAAE